MAGVRKTPKLRFNGKYYVANIYKPNGKRSTISFGPLASRTEGEIYKAFGQWLDLYNQFPHKVLSYKTPYEAIDNIINPSCITSVGQLLNHYKRWVLKTSEYIGENRANELIIRTEKVMQFLDKFSNWLIEDFGPDELRDFIDSMKRYRYPKGKSKVPYARTTINTYIRQVRIIWNWGVGREYVTHAQAKKLEEIKLLRSGQWQDKSRRAKVEFKEFIKVTNNVTSVLADILWLIWYTAMRPSEVCNMRPFDLLRDDTECWIYIPGRDVSPVGEHKTSRFEKVKVIPLTTKSQEIIKKRVVDWYSKDYIFKPVVCFLSEFCMKHQGEKADLRVRTASA